MTFPDAGDAGRLTHNCWQAAAAQVLERDDLSAHWAQILVQRLAMYRSLKDDTVRKFGAEHFRSWDDTYAFFVSLFRAGQAGRWAVRGAQAAVSVHSLAENGLVCRRPGLL